MAKLLTKSRYLNGLKCPKYLWLVCNAPDQIPAVDAATQSRFDQGNEVGELAKTLFPGGVDIPAENFSTNVAQTGKLLRERKTLFEAGIMVENLYCRVDVLQPVPDGRWDIVEVKSSTDVKDEHVQDAVFQRFCLEKKGLSVRKCSIAYINNKYVRHGPVDPRQLFVLKDITWDVDEAAAGIEDRIAGMIAIVAAASGPEVLIGSHCADPYECPVTVCRESLPENTILDLHRGGQAKFDLFHDGVLFLKDIPTGFKLSTVQKIQQECDAAGQPHVDKDAIRSFLGTMEYPLSYLDFETFMTAVPLFDGTRPYQQLPFQFSVHVVDNPGAVPVHRSFLADGNGDPRPALLSALKAALPPSGSLVVYNQSFEKRVLSELGDAFPGDKGWTSSVTGRLVDLLSPFRSFCYYHPAQKGSASIKHVLPVLTGQSYADLSIAEGNAASLAYLRLMSPDVPGNEKKTLRADLEKYCGLDTQGMIWIVDALAQMAF